MLLLLTFSFMAVGCFFLAPSFSLSMVLVSSDSLLQFNKYIPGIIQFNEEGNSDQAF